MTYSASSPILGHGLASAAAIDAWVHAHNPQAPALGTAVHESADAYGVNSDLVIAQAMHETGWWTSTWAIRSNNPAGLGVTGVGNAGLSFQSIAAGFDQQVAHLLTYVQGTASPLYALDIRGAAVLAAGYAGAVHVLSDLDGRWAVPGVGYGASIATLANALVTSAGGATVAEPTQIGGIPVVWIPAADGNWDGQRTGHDLVIVHDIEGSAASAVSTFQVVGRQASTQFVLDPGNGRIVQMVSLDAVAYGCGNYADNQRASQFEMPGYAGRTYDPTVIDQAVAVTAFLCQRDNIPVVRLSLSDVAAGKRGICGHQDVPDPSNPSLGGGVDHHNDPGPTFPWDSFIARVAAIVNGTPQVMGVNVPVAPDVIQLNGHTLGHGFKAFWDTFGGLPIFGYPITEEVSENGITVQWFERARFEWHPGSDPSRFDVMLGRLGAEALDARAKAAPTP